MGNDILQAALKKYQTLILPLVAVIIALALFGFVVIPQGMKIPETNKEIQTVETDLKNLNSKLATLQTINPDEVQKDLETSFHALPQDPDIAGVFNQIFTILAENGLTLDDVGISYSHDDNASPDYLMKFNSTGPIDSLKNFIDRTKTIPRVVKVQSLEVGLGSSQLAAGSTATDVQTLQILVTIQAFFQTLPATQSIKTDAPISLPSEDEKKIITNIEESLKTIPQAASQSTVPSGKEDPFVD